MIVNFFHGMLVFIPRKSGDIELVLSVVPRAFFPSLGLTVDGHYTILTRLIHKLNMAVNIQIRPF